MTCQVGCNGSKDDENSGDKTPLAEETTTSTDGLPIDPDVSFAAPAVGGSSLLTRPTPPSAADIISGLQLPADETNEELFQFFQQCDAELKRLATTPISLENADAVEAELKRVAKLKQAAAERLLENKGELSEEQQITALGARLRALSHQAAVGDLSAGNELEAFARTLVNHPEVGLQRDSRTTLLALSTERLQGGLTTNPDYVEQHAMGLLSAPALLDVSAVAAVQQSIKILVRYGYVEPANRVQEALLNAVEQSSDPRLSGLKERLLTEGRFAALEALQRDIADAEQRTPEEWRKAASQIAQEHPDRTTLQYLISLALQLESLDRESATAVIYEVVKTHLTTGVDAELAAEANYAIQARARRIQAIGQPFPAIDLATLDGKPFKLEDFRDAIVIMPFWSVKEPESMMVAAALEDYVRESSLPLRLIGVNMDYEPEALTAATKMATEEMSWPSIAGFDRSSGTMNALQDALGIVTLPTVVVVGPDGKVAKVALSQTAIEAAVNSL